MKIILFFVVTYVATVGGVWGLLEAPSYFGGDSLKTTLGPYWWLVIYGIPLVISVGATAKRGLKDDGSKHHKTPQAAYTNSGNAVGRDLVNGNVININIGTYKEPGVDATSVLPPIASPSNAPATSPDLSVKQPEKPRPPLRVMFRDGVEKSISFSIQAHVKPKDAPWIVAIHGDMQNARENLCQLVEASVMAELEKRTEQEIRGARQEVASKILESTAIRAAELGFTVTDINLKEII